MGNNGFSFVVNIVHRGSLDLSILEEECSEHADRTHIEIINQIIVVLLFKRKPALSESSKIQVKDEVIIDYSFFVKSFVLSLIGNSD